jgi:hypothetical protein
VSSKNKGIPVRKNTVEMIITDGTQTRACHFDLTEFLLVEGLK